MATSRPIRQGDNLTRLNDEGPRGYGAHRIATGRELNEEFVLHDDFGLTNQFDSEYRRAVCDRVFGISDCFDFRDPRLVAAITNGTAPGLYVREGDDTSNWETYRQVLARRVEEAMAARRGGEGRIEAGETVTAETATTRQDDEIRVGDVVEVVSCSDIHYTRRSDVGGGGRITQRGDNRVQLIPVDGMRLPSMGIAAITDVRKVSPSPQIVAANVSQIPPPSSRPAPQPSSSQPPPPPSRFSLLEVDFNTDAPVPQAPKPSAGLAALQQELRAEREAKRALAAAQTPPGRFDLLECDLPAVPAAATMPAKAPPQRPVVSSSPSKPLSPVETITDLTAARSPLELARMLEGLNDELSTMMRQREAN